MRAVWPAHADPVSAGADLPCPKCGDSAFRLGLQQGWWTCDGCLWQGEGWKELVTELLGPARWRELTGTKKGAPGMDPRAVPPGDEGTERAALGSLLLGAAEALAAHQEAGLRPEHFRNTLLGEAYLAALALLERGAPVDPVTLDRELQARGTLERVGGTAAVVGFFDAAATSANALAHAAQVVEDHRRRQLQNAGQRLIDAAGGKGEIAPALSEAQRLLTEAPTPSSAISTPLDRWRVEAGQIVEARSDREGRIRLEQRFAGTIRVVKVEVTRQEDAEAPGGWAEERRVVYEVRLPGAAPVFRALPAGIRPLSDLLDREYASANSCHGVKDGRLLLQFVERTAAEAEHVETVRAVGPHRQLGGWVAPPSVIVCRGKVEASTFALTAPGELQDLARYRLLALEREQLVRVARWVVSDLLRIDHAEGAFVLPVLGGIVGAPLWPYLPTLASWQRYAVFIQGTSGIGKTWLTRALLSLWGDFLADPEGLTTWQSSAASVEDLLHQVVAAPVLVADFKRANMSGEAWKAAQALIQAYGDRSSRGRAEASGRGRRRRPPRCQLLIDGEDLPAGQQATLGRLLIVQAEPRLDPRCPDGNRCVTTEGLDLAMLKLLPGVTAAWIAWVQREAGTLGVQLGRTVAALEEDLRDAPSTTNRSRVLRNYAVQLTALAGFATFLEDECGVVGAYQAIQPRAVEVHRELALRQLGTVGQEAAAELFLDELAQLLHAGIAFLRPRDDQSGKNPFEAASKLAGGTCVGTYDHEGIARLLPDVALGLVQQRRGHNDRIEFSRQAIEQQLEQSGALEDGPEKERLAKGRHQKPVRVWRVRLERLSHEPGRNLWDPEEP